jgi:hypothetical protein
MIKWTCFQQILLLEKQGSMLLTAKVVININVAGKKKIDKKEAKISLFFINYLLFTAK